MRGYTKLWHPHKCSLCNQDPQKARQVTLDFTNYLRKNFTAVASESGGTVVTVFVPRLT